MKTIRNIIIGLLVFFGLVYFGQANKALRTKPVLLKIALEEKKISQAEYEKELSRVTLVNILLDPKFVLSVD